MDEAICCRYSETEKGKQCHTSQKIFVLSRTYMIINTIWMATETRDNNSLVWSDTMFCYHCGNPILPHHKFCASCGKKIDLDFLHGSTTSHGKRPSERAIDYRDLFQKMEATLKKESTFSEEEFEKKWGRFKNLHYKNNSNQDLFWKLVQVVFYAGMTAATVTSRLPALKKYLGDYLEVKDLSREDIDAICKDPAVIKNRRKIEDCVKNAKIFHEIVEKHGSFSSYIESFGDLKRESTLEELNKSLQNFEGIGKITAYHFMLDMGLNVWKPDRVVLRILNRLGLLDNKGDIEEAVRVGRRLAGEIGLPIRYIDIVFVKYGQRGEEEGFGLKNGICMETNPRCSICGITEYCQHMQH